MNALEVDNFEEMEYDLSGIGLDGYYLTLESDMNYIYSDYGFYMEIIDKTNLSRSVKKVDKYGNILLKNEDGDILSLKKNQYDEIFTLLK